MEVDDPLDRINRALKKREGGTPDDTTEREDPLARIDRALGDEDGGGATGPRRKGDPDKGGKFPDRPEEGALQTMLEYATAPVRGASNMTASMIEGFSAMPAPAQRSGAAAERVMDDSPQVQQQRQIREAQRKRIERTLEGESGFAEAAEAVRRYAEERLPDVSRKERDTFAMRTLEGLGSVAPYMASAAAGPLSLPVGATLGIAGSEGEMIQQARRQKQQAEAEGRHEDVPTAEEVQRSTPLAAVAGATETLPVERALSRAVPAPLKRKAMDVALGALEEASQEAFGTVVRNIAAQEFDPERDITEGIGEAAKTGGAVGFLVNAISTLAGGRGPSPDAAPMTETETDARTEGGTEAATEEDTGAATDPAGQETGQQRGGRRGRDPSGAQGTRDVQPQEELAAAVTDPDPAERIDRALEEAEAGQLEAQPAEAEQQVEAQQTQEAEPTPKDRLFSALEGASLEELAAIQQTSESPAVLEEVQQARVVQKGDDPSTAVELPEVDPEEVDVSPEITMALSDVVKAESQRFREQIESETFPSEPQEQAEAEEQEGVEAQEPGPAGEEMSEEGMPTEERDDFVRELSQAPVEELEAAAASPEIQPGEAEVLRREVERRREEGELTADDVDAIVSQLPDQTEAGQEAETAAEQETGPQETETEGAETEEQETLQEARQLVEEERGKVVSGEQAVDYLPELDSPERTQKALQQRLETLQSQVEGDSEPDPAVLTEAAILQNALDYQQAQEGTVEEAAEEGTTAEEAETATDVDVPAAPQVRRERQPAREAITGLPRDEMQVMEEIARTSEDPAEIALAYRQAQSAEEARTQGDRLARAIEDVGRIETQSYEDVVGSNLQRDENAVRLRFLSREGRPIDDVAMEVSSELGREVSVQEVADKVREMGTRPRGRTTADRLADQFERVTGRPMTPTRADQAIEQAIEEEQSATPAEPEAAQDIPTDPTQVTEAGSPEITAPFQRTRRLSSLAQLRSQRGERLFRGRPDGERIQPDPQRTAGDVPTFREMLETLQEQTGIEIQRSQLPRAAAGMYEAPTGATVVRTPNDVDTAIHEVAHAIDDKHGVLEEWAGDETSPLDDELVPHFSQHGSGAAGQETESESGNPTYERAEGFAEWLRAYALNPQEARRRAPETFERYREAVPEDIREAIETFGRELRNYAAAAEAGDPQATLANVETDLDPPGLMESFKQKFDFLFESLGVGDTWMDRLAVEVWDDMRVVMKVWDAAANLQGRDLDQMDLDDNFRILARLFNGLDTRVMRYFESGLEDMQGNTVTDGGFDHILSPLDTSSKQKLEQELADGVAFLVNERVIERATALREDAKAIQVNYEMIQDLKRELRNVENRLETARDRRDKARRQEDYRSDQFQGEEVIESLKARRDALTAVTRDLRRETKRAEQHLRTARRKRENARSALRRAEERWDNHREAMETVSDWERNESKTKELRREVERQQERYDKWQEKVMRLEETRDDLRAQLDEANGDLESARDQIDQERSHQRRLESAEERIEKYEEEVERLAETRDAVREDLQQAEERMNEAKRSADYTGHPSNVEEWAERRVERLAGTGGGIFSDEDVALKYLRRLQEDPARMDRVQSFARRYREWADALLQRLRDAGILSQEQIDGIRERNQHYAAFNRVEGQEEAFVMGGVDSDASGAVGGLASDEQIIYRFKGSTRTMRNPLVSLIGQTHAVVQETERNQMLQAFVNPFRSDRAMYEGDVMDLGRIARKATSEDKRTIEVKIDGETEYWQLHPEIYKQMKNIDGVEQQSGFIRMIQQAVRFSRSLITYSPAFVTRQLIRDPQEVAIKSESGFKPWENLTYLVSEESREQFTDDVAALESAGGAQFGWHVRGREGYYEQLRRTIDDLAGDSGTVVTSFQKVLDTYKRLVEKSEIASRVGDFQRRYEELLDQGMDEYDARRKAAYQTRNLMDFAQGGRAMKQLNKFIPFLNASVQGMRTAMRAGRENPSGLAWRFLLYGLSGDVAAYVWNTLVGGEEGLERWRQEPAYLKDFFYTFHIPGAEWLTLRIPKTYEFGLLSSLTVRGLEKGLSMASGGERGDDDAFAGAGASAATAFMPLDPSAVASSPGLSLLNVQANWDPFRQRHIVSPYESKLDLDLRRGDDYASRLAQGLQQTGMAADEGLSAVGLGHYFGMDARKWDYLIQSLGGGSGRLLTTASDIGRTSRAGREFWMDASGLFVHPPVYGSRDVQYVLGWAERRGKTSLDAVKRVEDLVDRVYAAEDAETRRARAQQLWEYAGQLREEIEEQPTAQ